MDSYNQRNVRLAGNIITICGITGFVGWWLSHNYIFINIIALPVGLTAIVFSHDLTMQGKAKYRNLNYKFYRGAFIVVGLLLIVFGIIGLVNH